MRTNNNEGCGCIVFVAIIAGILALISLYQGTESYMINDAREHHSCSYYENYINKHPNGEYVGEAEDSIISILQAEENNWEVYDIVKSTLSDSVRLKAAQIAYNKAVELNTVYGWMNYKERVPYEYMWDANDRITAIRDAEKRAEEAKWATENAAWEMVSNNKSRGFCLKYLQKYPKGKHKKQVIDMLVSNDFFGCTRRNA